MSSLPLSIFLRTTFDIIIVLPTSSMPQQYVGCYNLFRVQLTQTCYHNTRQKTTFLVFLSSRMIDFAPTILFSYTQSPAKQWRPLFNQMGPRVETVLPRKHDLSKNTKQHAMRPPFRPLCFHPFYIFRSYVTFISSLYPTSRHYHVRSQHIFVLLYL